jgi:hypothetical protein
MKRKRSIPKFLPPGLRAFRERRLPLRRWKGGGARVHATIFNAGWMSDLHKAVLEAERQS